MARLPNHKDVLYVICVTYNTSQSFFKLGPPNFAWNKIQIIPTCNDNDDDDNDDDNDDNDDNDDDAKLKWP